MIELIFAIVIMGIVFLSVPNLISVATKSGYISLQQESIAVAASQLNLLLTKQWDENNVIDTSTGIDGTTILNTGGTASLAARPGAKSRSFVTSTGNGPWSATSIGSEVSDFDDIDDAHGTLMSLRNFSDTNISSGDIIDINIHISTIVDYVTDSTSGPHDYNTSKTIQYNFTSTPITPAGTTTNIKAVSISLTTSDSTQELDKNISLKAFTTNIGSYSPARRPL
jgi:hypothetical protein